MPDPSLPTTIIPRLPTESARAHAAKVAYVTMGPQRSLEKARQNSGKTAAYVRQLEEWSRHHDWQATARAWDDQQAALAAQRASAQYLADLEEHRQRYQQVGRGLYTVAAKLLKRLDAQASDPTLELRPTDLGTLTKALTVAADLEAHALRLADLLPKLSGPDDV